jgi:hypothetical protein
MTTRHLPNWADRIAERRSALGKPDVSPETATGLAKIRAEAAEPGILFVVVRSEKGAVALSPEDITERDDAKLAAFIASRLDEQKRCEAVEPEPDKAGYGRDELLTAP